MRGCENASTDEYTQRERMTEHQDSSFSCCWADYGCRYQSHICLFEELKIQTKPHVLWIKRCVVFLKPAWLKCLWQGQCEDVLLPVSLGSVKKLEHLGNFSNSFVRWFLIFRCTRDPQPSSKGREITETPNINSWGQSDRFNRSLCDWWNDSYLADRGLSVWFILACPVSHLYSFILFVCLPLFCKVTFFVLLINLCSEVFLQQPLQPLLPLLLFSSIFPLFISEAPTSNLALCLTVRVFFSV